MISKFYRLTDANGVARIIHTEQIFQLSKEPNGGWRLSLDGNSASILLTDEVGEKLGNMLAPPIPDESR